jgi:hypothetical protein
MNKRLIASLGSVAAVLAIGSAALLSGFGMSQTSDILYMTDGPSFQDVADLTRASKAVAQVRIVSVGASYLVPFDNASTVVGAAPSDSGPKGKAGQQASSIPAAPTPGGILKTDFTVEVLDNVHGASLHKGQQIVVSQLGGIAPSKAADAARAGAPAEVGMAKMISAHAEHDALMQAGDEEVMFLNQDASTGKFFTTGGGLGRFKVQSNGSVLAVDHDNPLGRLHNGKPASFLKSAVQSVHD